MKVNTSIIREMEDHIVPLLQTCSSISQTKKIHAHIIHSSLSQSNFLATKLVDICRINTETNYATLVFNQVIEPNIFLYNAIIQAYSHNRCYIQAISIYQDMLRRPKGTSLVIANRFTYPFVIKASAGLRRLDLGKLIHGHVFKCGPTSNSVIENSLIEMYTKCHDLANAQNVFDRMPERDVVSWNTLILAYAELGKMRKAKMMFDSMANKTVVSWTTMISGYSRNGSYSDALAVFHQMLVDGMKPDAISVVAVLPACAQLGALELGKWIHVYSDKKGLLKMICVCNALIEMYAKCGSIDQAYQVFDSMLERDVISWSTMIGGFANHGLVQEAIRLFADMERTCIKPNTITFLGLLSACAHAGFLQEGLKYFDLMTKGYHFNPGIEHYGRMVDLLGRSGCLEQAIEFINKMPFKPDATIWGALLSACRIHGNVEIAIISMEHLIELEPDEIGNYVLLSNTYAAAGRWDDVSRLRKVIRSKRMKKTPGCSLIEVNNVVQEFVAGNGSCLLPEEIVWMLKLLALELSKTRTVTCEVS